MNQTPKRHPHNKNLRYTTEQAYMGSPVNQNHGPLIENYLATLYQGLVSYTYRQPRALAVRFELLYPANYRGRVSNEQITQFFKGLKYRLDKATEQKVNRGQRAHPHDLAYAWFKEMDTSSLPHYHALILLNRNAYFKLGDFRGNDNLYGLLKASWAGALGLEINQIKGLVNASINNNFAGSSPCVDLIQNDESFVQRFDEMFYRLSYLCKARTKNYGENERSFGSGGFDKN